MSGASRARPPSWLGLVFAVAVALAAALIVSYRRAGRAEGLAVCVARGNERDACEAAVSENHLVCWGLNYTGPGRRMPGPGKLDENGYVECLLLGPEAHKAAHLKRLEQQRKLYGQPALPPP